MYYLIAYLFTLHYIQLQYITLWIEGVIILLKKGQTFFNFFFFKKK